MVHKGRRFFSQNLRCFCTIVDKPKDSETSLILYDGSNSLRLESSQGPRGPQLSHHRT